MLQFKMKYKAIFLIIPIVMFSRYELIFFPTKTEERVGEVFLLHMFGGSYNMERANLSMSVMGLIGIIYLSLLFADYISNEMKEGAEYVFSRYFKRQKWYIKKVTGLCIYCNVGIFLYMFPYVLNAWYESEQNIDKNDILVVLCTYAVLVLFSYCMIMSINLCAICYDTMMGFVLTYSMLIISSELMILIQKLPDERMAGLLHRINPMSNILVSWNFNDSYVRWGLGYYIVFAVCITLFLWKKVKEYEIGIGLKNKVGRKWIRK